MARRFSTWILLTTMSGFLLSCVATVGCVSKNSSQTPWKMKPQESFGLVVVKIKMSPFECTLSNKSGEKPCDVEEIGADTKIVTSVGSSIVVSHSKKQDKTYVLTAAHVCEVESQVETFPFETKGNQYQIKVKNEVVSIEIIDYNGSKRSASLYRLDKPNDLCVVYTKDKWGHPFRVSSSMPSIGEKVFNVSSPHKIWSPGMVLMLDGYYSGKATNSFHHYTIPAKPGSSGSPVFNCEGEIVGMIQRATIGFENLALSTSVEAIREIVNSIPKDSQTPSLININLPKLEN